MNIKDSVVVATGASSGIGLATASLLAKSGARVALVARSKDKLKQIAQKLPNSFSFPADMSKKTEIKRMIKRIKEHFGRIDVLINNAGQGYDSPIENIKISSFKYLFDLDVLGPLIAMQQVVPIMRQQKQGTIINISSGTALMYLPNMAAYSSLKRALVGLSLTARAELEKDNISVSVVYPFITDTDFEKNTIKDFANGNQTEDSNDHDLPEADSAEYVAQKIIDVMMSGESEIFAHEWMKKQFSK